MTENKNNVVDVQGLTTTKYYLTIWWDGNNSIDIYELGKKGIQALDEGNFEDYMDERFGTCVSNHATWYVSEDKPQVKMYRQKV